MKVSQLIEELAYLDPDMEVKFAYNYGDYWKTTVADEISSVDIEEVKWSGYHSMWKIEKEDDRYEDEDEESTSEETKKVVVLS